MVGPLLASPRRRGELRAALEELAAKTWRHPTNGGSVRFSARTLERWYYAAKNSNDPVSALRRKERSDAGAQRSVSAKVRRLLEDSHRAHSGWSGQLHYDNVQEEAKQAQEEMPSYATVRRYMRSHGMKRVRARSGRKTQGTEKAAQRLEKLEVRSYEATHVGGLWHSDFHEGSREVLLTNGTRCNPKLFGMLDDRSRHVAHLQWYLQESAQTFVHGMTQGFLKVGLPRALMTDNGGAMLAAETQAGLLELGITHEKTLPESPYQNGKQESFWGQVEQRLLAMLEGVRELTLEILNEATQAWVHLEYNKEVHSELGVAPVHRFLDGPCVLRPCLDSDALRRAFRQRENRTQRRSDGTVSLAGIRFEVPSRFREFRQVAIRYARWDLTFVDMVDPRSGTVLARLFPLDKQKNADGRRRHLDPALSSPEPVEPSGKAAPLLARLMREHAATGLPPAYLPLSNEEQEQEQEQEQES